MKRALFLTCLLPTTTIPGFLIHPQTHYPKISHHVHHHHGKRPIQMSIHATTDGEQMMEAAKYGRLPEVQYYLDSGVDVNTPHDGRETALHLACYRGRLEVVELLLQRNAQVNVQDLEFGSTPLHLASSNGHFEIVQLLLKEGNADGNVVDKHGRTPLHVACARKEDKVVQVLLQYTVEVNGRDDAKETPLHIACAQGTEGIVKQLLQASSDVNAANGRYETPLHKACYGGHATCVKLLLEKGEAIHDARDENGKSPVEIARERFYPSIADLLDRYGVSKREERESAVSSGDGGGGSSSFPFGPSFPTGIANTPTYSPPTPAAPVPVPSPVNSYLPTPTSSTTTPSSYLPNPNVSSYSQSPTSTNPSYSPNGSSNPPSTTETPPTFPLSTNPAAGGVSYSSSPSPASSTSEAAEKPFDYFTPRDTSATSSTAAEEQPFDYFTPRDTATTTSSFDNSTPSPAPAPLDFTGTAPPNNIESKSDADTMREIESLLDSKLDKLIQMMEENKVEIKDSINQIQNSLTTELETKVGALEESMKEEKDRNDEAITEILDRLRSLEDIFGPPDEFGPRPRGRGDDGEGGLSKGRSTQNGANVEERIEQLAYNLGITLDPNQPIPDQVSNLEFIVCGKQMSGLLTARVASLEEELGV